MKKRSFLLPLAVSLAALTAGSGIATAKEVAPTTVSAPTGISPSDVIPAAKPLVLNRAAANKVQYAAHRSHSSHSSHSSHRSHHSSR